MEQKTHRFTWFDGLVLLALLALMAGAVLRLHLLEGLAPPDDSRAFTYTLEIRGAEAYVTDAICRGDMVYDDATFQPVGVIEQIDLRPARVMIDLPQGGQAEGIQEEQYDVTLTISANGSPRSDGYQLENYRLRLGDNQVFFTKYALWTATVASMD